MTERMWYDYEEAADAGTRHRRFERQFRERRVLLCGHTVERVRADYGYDLFLLNYNAEGEIESGDVRLQLKATDGIRFAKDRQAVIVKISRSDLILWNDEMMPVILILYDAQADMAYWLYVQRHFERLGGFNPFSVGTTVTLRLPTANVVNQEAVRQFAEFRANVLRQGEIHHDRGEGR